MLARKRSYLHTNGEEVELPLLVPSFSSKGFRFQKRKSKKRSIKDTERRAGVRTNHFSQTNHALTYAGTYLEESLLVSAYDIFHEYFEDPLPNIKNAQLIFLDSGGYELATDFDSTEPKHLAYIPEVFEPDDYANCLESLSKQLLDSGVVFANYDFTLKNQPIKTQISNARKLFKNFPDWDGNLILKPSTKTGNMIQIEEIISNARLLRGVKIIGVTEKEIGKNLIDKLRNVAKLRRGLDDAGVKSPIHIWGGLDPILTPLFFFAGAEIFDGVSWLRYAYIDGVAVNREAYSALKLNVNLSLDHSIFMCMNDNLAALSRLSTNLREFVDLGGTSFDMFEENSNTFEQAYRTMKTRIPSLNGGA